MACFPPPLINTRKNEWKILGMQQKRQPKILNKKALKESTNEALNIMNKSFEQTYGISFEESLLANSSNFEKSSAMKKRGKSKINIFGKQWKKLKMIIKTH